MGLLTMTRDLAGHGSGGRCLFLLDEFHSLGKVDLVAKASGLMRGYGVQLWPFLQDLGQLVDLYGKEGAETFFGNADAHIFFGNTDATTLNTVAAGLGVVEAHEIGPAPIMGSGINPITGATVGAIMGGNSRHSHERMTGAFVGGLVGAMGAALHDMEMSAKQEEMNEYQQKAMTVGKPRVPPDQVRELVAKHDGDDVARSMIVFAKGGDKLNIRLAPYFLPPRPRSALPPANLREAAFQKLATAPKFVIRAAIVLGFWLLPLLALNAFFALAPNLQGTPPGIALAAAAFAAALWWLLKSEHGKALRGMAGWRRG